MASGYALPHTLGGNHNGHSQSYAYLTPDTVQPDSFSSPNGTLKKFASSGSLYTHNERSRETSPSPYHHEQYLNQHHGHQHHQHQPSHSLSHSHSHQHFYAPNLAPAFANNERVRPGHTHSHSHSPMKGWARADSDLGNPTALNGYAAKAPLDAVPVTPNSWFSWHEILTSILIPLPYLLASAAYSLTAGSVESEQPFPLSAYGKLKESVLSESWNTHEPVRHHGSGFVEATGLTAGTLLATGAIKYMMGARERFESNTFKSLSPQTLSLRLLAVGLPFYSSMQIGGMRTGLLLLIAAAAGITRSAEDMKFSPEERLHSLATRKATLAAMLLCLIADLSGLTILASSKDLLFGYAALATAICAVPNPVPSILPSLNSYTDIIAGLFSAMIAILVATMSGAVDSLSNHVVIFGFLSIAAMTVALIYGQSSSLRSPNQAGLYLGILLTAGCAFLFSPTLWPGTICNGGLSALTFLGVLFDTNATVEKDTHNRHVHEHAHNTHSHSHGHHQHSGNRYSILTKFFLNYVTPGSLIHSILSEKDSRRIAYFTTLNFGFMFIQGVYGYLSGSLGLLSDTVHMFFDCLALVVGLGAAVASKWPTSPEKPYGWGKLNTLAGFGNGIFLMLVSVEFVWEAVEGILEGKELRHVKELLIVSTLGLFVNMIGLFAFGHAHHGHDHGHDHSHGGHDHNDNMHGIFLHVAADAGGSLAVIISTALTLWKPWYIWDPLAAIIIAILIFAAAVPLVTSSGQKLLLVIPGDLEYNIKDTLQGLSEIRGVLGYAAPKFWLDDRDSSGDSHGHTHHHDHSHHHNHTHLHDHHHGHDHGHGHNHDHGHDHQHNHDHHHHHHHEQHSEKRILGMIHVIAVYNADLDDVRERIDEFVRERNMSLVIHVEREGEPCWCSSG